MQHKILAETLETESRSAAFWGIPMFSESGRNGQGILGWKSKRAATKYNGKASVKCDTIRE